MTAFPDQFVGVGLELTMRDNQATVVRALDGGPAAEAGLHNNDRIVAVDNVSIEGLELPDVVLRLRGQSGSPVALTYVRDGERTTSVVVRHEIDKRADGYVARSKN